MSPAKGTRAVAVGGGTGLPKVLSALLHTDHDVTAVVTMADDGGSSGKLRQEIGILPPGDVRNCLVALSDRSDLHAGVFQYRFPHGEGLAGHALGNLIIAALTDITGDFVEAVRVAGEWLGSRGTVLPSTLEDIRLLAVDREGMPVAGQAVIANNPVPIERVALEPEEPSAYEPAIEALTQADLVVVGPGSLYTSIIPNFLVAGVADALRTSRACRVYLCNVANQRGETGGMDAAEHVEALLAHGLEDALDVVVVHNDPCADTDAYSVDASDAVVERIRSFGLEVVVADVADPDDLRHHGVEQIVHALKEVADVVHR